MAKDSRQALIVDPQGFDVAAQHAHAERVEGCDERLGRGMRGPSSLSTRSAISAEALLVKVTARMESGATPFSWISHAMRLVMTRVLPEPAPARMSSGPSVVSTAARCSGFRFAMSDGTSESAGRSFSSLPVTGFTRRAGHHRSNPSPRARIEPCSICCAGWLSSSPSS